MLLGAVVSGLVCLGVARLLAPRWGWVPALVVTGFVWSLTVVALVTLIPYGGAPGWVFAEDRLPYCSTDIGGPAPDGFWIFPSGQRLLNMVLFAPSGALAVLAVAAVTRRWRVAVLLAPACWLGLAAYSFLIELVQLELARLDRACDLTDWVDNVLGATLGLLLGLALLPVLRPWRRPVEGKEALPAKDSPGRL